MNQIPNIEEEKTRKESRKRFGRFYTQLEPPIQENEWGEKEAFGSDDIENFWIETLHQQLQKAREHAFRKGYLAGYLHEEPGESYDRYLSELDQDVSK